MNLSYRDIFLVLFGAGFTAFVNSVSSNQDASQAIPVSQMAAVDAVIVEEAEPKLATSKLTIEIPSSKAGEKTFLEAFDSESKLTNAERWHMVATYFSEEEGANKPNFDLSQPALAATYLNQLITDSGISFDNKLAIADALQKLQDAPNQPGVVAYFHDQLDEIDEPAQQVRTLKVMHEATEEYMLDEVVLLLDSDASEVRLAALEVLVHAPHSDALEQRLNRLYESDQSDEVSKRALTALTKFREQP
ncbi:MULTISPECIES: hypothetical protein [Corallincola]|uniref:HEAT repeat domain-containing protein n=2 Tax=Corallincola TaxID=1775176 RepID=A0A368NST5_9GAMM|nr:MULTISPECIES: hypothetical protein [Corallincola]RCU52885.1 hypothetical protein DU002_02675 [Corallincola holothuriorum]TAA47962.1 hypothetical protein EXY25_01580 [Corallincola spongiicola]